MKYVGDPHALVPDPEEFAMLPVYSCELKYAQTQPNIVYLSPKAELRKMRTD